MEQFVVSARKYRPMRFADVVGQEHITQTLLNALRMGRPAHAYLFCGPRGVGKTTCARILAKAVNCLSPTVEGEPCNVCDSCRHFNEGRSLTIFELDAASNNSVDDVRQLIEQLRYIPQGGRRSVYIIDEVHMLSTAAFNAFLKTLEEPPAHALFILATTEKHKIPATILSRCQKFDFRRIPPEPITAHLAAIAHQENIDYEEEALYLIAQKADGGLRDALSLFDTLVNFGQGRLSHAVALDQLNVLDYDVYFQLTDLMRTGDHAEALLLFNGVIERGFDGAGFLSGLIEHLRNLLVGRQAKTFALLEVSQSVRRRYQEQAKAIDPALVLQAFHLALEVEQKYRNSRQPRLLIELLLIRIVHLQMSLEPVAEAVSGLEKKKALTASEPADQFPEAVPPIQAQPELVQSQQATTPSSAESTSQAAQTPPRQPRAGTQSKSGKSLFSLELDDLDDEVQELVHARPEAAETEPVGPDLDARLIPAFASYLKTRPELTDKQSLNAILQHRQMEARGSELCLVLANDFEWRFVEAERPWITELARQQFDHPSLKLTYRVDPDLQAAEEERLRQQSSEYRLAQMLASNPCLQTLIERLGLQPE